MAGTRVDKSIPTKNLEPSLPKDPIQAGQKQGKAVTPVNPKNQIPSPPAPEHTQDNQRDVKSVEQESADNNPIQKQSSPEAISKIQEILKEDGTLAQSYKKLVKKNSVQRTSDILEALLHDNSLWKKKPDKALTSFIKKLNPLIKDISSLKIAIDIAPYGKVQLIPAGDQLKALSTDQLRELVEVSLQLAKGMLPLVELDQSDNQNSRQNIETLEHEVQANISELSEEHQQQVREKLKSVQNPTLHISIRGIDLWPDIQPALDTTNQTILSQNDQPELPKGKTPEEAALIATRIEKFSQAAAGDGLKPEDIKANNQRKKLVNDEIAKHFQKTQRKLNEESETPRIPKPPKVPTPLKTPETEKAPLPPKSPTAPVPAVTANSKQPVINQQKTEATQLLDLNEQQIQFFENEQLWQFFESSKQYDEVADIFPQLLRNQEFNEIKAAKASLQRNTLEKLPSLEELIQKRRTLKLKELYFTETPTSDHEELSNREVCSDDVDFFRAFYAYPMANEKPLDNTYGAQYFSNMLNTINEDMNAPEETKTAIINGIKKFNILLKEEAPVNSTLGKKVIQALNKHSNKTLAEAIFTHCFTTPVFNHRNYDGLIKALALSQPLNSHDLFDLKSLTDCIASQLMTDFDIPLSDGKSEGILIKDDRYMLRVAGDFFDAVDKDEE
ncbi:hypothetical protein [uncultured Endozoicomonas sp.]|uniref:hypothetical protein n=1 Tax=uncultured Endozoicomonas sp. TaxID=432652 RepID=UPI00261D947E|nr:hypothetical protein [uncultured Endozoicomonas sp.]